MKSASGRSRIKLAKAALISRLLMSYDDSALVTPHNAPFPTYKAALTYGLPSCYAFRETVQAGGLVSLGPDRVWMAKQAADYKIIRGAKPEKLPIQQPDRYELHVNLTTAKLLGLEIPDTLLARADELIE